MLSPKISDFWASVIISLAVAAFAGLAIYVIWAI